MAVAVDSVLDRLLGRLLPPRCVLCGRPGQYPAHDLCLACDDCMPLTPGNALLCRASPPDRLFAPYAYAPPVDAMIQALKYRGHLTLGRVLGELLARRATELGLQLDVDCVMPVPLHPQRHASRGFNQSAEIARFAARRLRLPVAAGIAVRQMATRPQVGLSAAERGTNLVNAFAASAGGVRGRRIVIVDDVVTTGSTVAELARTLRSAGAVSVDAWCVAHTDVQALPVAGACAFVDSPRARLPARIRGCIPENPSAASVTPTAPSRSTSKAAAPSPCAATLPIRCSAATPA